MRKIKWQGQREIMRQNEKGNKGCGRTKRATKDAASEACGIEVAQMEEEHTVDLRSSGFRT